MAQLPLVLVYHIAPYQTRHLERVTAPSIFTTVSRWFFMGFHVGKYTVRFMDASWVCFKDEKPQNAGKVGKYDQQRDVLLVLSKCLS